jgi:predicted transcriptional regulator
MATNNNLRVSDELRAQAAEIAKRQGRTADDLAAEALAHYIETQKIAQDLSDLASWGARHARERGFKPSDVEHAISDVRRGR